MEVALTYCESFLKKVEEILSKKFGLLSARDRSLGCSFEEMSLMWRTDAVNP